MVSEVQDLLCDEWSDELKAKKLPTLLESCRLARNDHGTARELREGKAKDHRVVSVVYMHRLYSYS